MASKFSPPESRDALGAKLRIARLSRGLTQQDLALKSGVERSQISKIESGKARTINANVKILCKFFDINFGTLDSTSKRVSSLEERLQLLAERSPELLTVVSSVLDALETAARVEITHSTSRRTKAD